MPYLHEPQCKVKITVNAHATLTGALGVCEDISDLAVEHEVTATHLRELALLVWEQGHELPYWHVAHLQPLDAVGTHATNEVAPDSPHWAVVTFHSCHPSLLHGSHQTVDFLTPLFARAGSLRPHQCLPKFNPC